MCKVVRFVAVVLLDGVIVELGPLSTHTRLRLNKNYRWDSENLARPQIRLYDIHNKIQQTMYWPPGTTGLPHKLFSVSA